MDFTKDELELIVKLCRMLSGFGACRDCENNQFSGLMDSVAVDTLGYKARRMAEGKK